VGSPPPIHLSVTVSDVEVYGETRAGDFTHGEPWAAEPMLAHREGVDGVVLVLADGGGSWEDGRLGARRAVALVAEALARTCEATTFDEAFGSASEALAQWNATRGVSSVFFQDTPPDVACSVVAAVITRDEVVLAWMGDAAGFVARDGRIVHALEPDTLGARLVAEGKLRAEELPSFPHANIVINVFGQLGVRAAPRVLRCPRLAGDVVVLASCRVAAGLNARTTLPTDPCPVVRALLGLAPAEHEAAAIAARL
jgi:serine/threonine protein phosphatase PrpC